MRACRSHLSRRIVPAALIVGAMPASTRWTRLVRASVGGIEAVNKAVLVR